MRKMKRKNLDHLEGEIMLEGKSIPMDGTLDQVRPLFRLQGQMEVYSFDLKSTTLTSDVFSSGINHTNSEVRRFGTANC